MHGRRVMGLAMPPLLACASLGIAQGGADSARSLLAAAVTAASVSTPEGYREAIRLRGRAAAIFRRVGDGRGEGEALSLTGLAWYFLGEPDSAVGYARSAYILRLAAGDTAGAVRSLAGPLGAAFEALGKADSAIATYYRAIELAHRTGDPLLEAQPTQNLGGVFVALSQPDSAFRWYHETIALARRGKDFRTEGEVLNNFSVIYDNLGNPDSALVYARQGWSVGKAEHGDSLIASALQNLGVIFTHSGAPDSALHYHRLAYEAAGRVLDAAGQRQVLMNIGVSLESLGQLDSAETYYHETIRRSRAAKDRSLEARALGNLGIVLTNRHQLDSAEATYHRVLQLHRALQNRSGEGIALVNLATVYAELNQTDSAAGAARTAYTIARDLDFPRLEGAADNVIGHVFQLRQQWDSARTYFHDDLALSRKAQDADGEGTSLMTLGALFRLQRDNAHAIAYFDSAAVVKVKVIGHVTKDEDRIAAWEQDYPLYEAWTLAWLERAGEIGNGPAAMGALTASEKGRAQALLELMDQPADNTGTDLSSHGTDVVTAVTRGGTALLEYHLAGDTLIAWSAGPDSSLSVHRAGIRADSLATLIRALRAGFGVEEGGARLVSRGVALEAGAPATVGTTRPAWRSAATALAEILLPPGVKAALAGSRDVLIVPQGLLALVPFTALPWGESGELLGTRHAVRYSPSLATAVATEQRAATSPRVGRALVVGNPAMPALQGGDKAWSRLGPLPGAEAEARAIAIRLDATLLKGQAATETIVRSRLSGAAVIHLATHGYAYATEGQARNSFVALAPDSVNDGLLRVGELLDDPTLHLAADLVALSACQTGLGNLKQAEGTIGLQRAFLAKGARSVLVSLWNVSDAATRQLMTGFYRHWLDDPDHPGKAEALRRAQEEVRKTPGFEHPRYWAAFQLVGAR